MIFLKKNKEQAMAPINSSEKAAQSICAKFMWESGTATKKDVASWPAV